MKASRNKYIGFSKESPFSFIIDLQFKALSEKENWKKKKKVLNDCNVATSYFETFEISKAFETHWLWFKHTFVTHLLTGKLDFLIAGYKMSFPKWNLVYIYFFFWFTAQPDWMLKYVVNSKHFNVVEENLNIWYSEFAPEIFIKFQKLQF